eukprot:269751_1
MPIDGCTWAAYYEPINHTIWLLSPLRCNTGCAFVEQIHGDIISYDIDHNIFATHPSILNITEAMQSRAPRYAAAVGDNIYFNGDLEETGNIDVYNIKTGITTTNIKSIISRDGCLVTDGRFLFIVGGQWLGTPAGTGTFHIYDTITDSWYRGSQQLYVPRRFPCEVIDGVIYQFGGDNAQPMTQITKFNIGTGDTVLANYNRQWEDAGSLIVPRAQHNSAQCENLVYIIGGYSSNDANVLSIEIYDINTELTQTAPFTLNEARVNPATMCIDQTIYVFGRRDCRCADLKTGTTRDSWEKSIMTASPTSEPTEAPTNTPSASPTSETDEPTHHPSLSPSKHPSVSPSDEATNDPSSLPSENPTNTPNIRPSIAPTMDPSYNDGHVQVESTMTPIVSQPNKDAQGDKPVDFVLIAFTMIALIIVVILILVLIVCFSFKLLLLHKESQEDVAVSMNEQSMPEMVEANGSLAVVGRQIHMKDMKRQIHEINNENMMVSLSQTGIDGNNYDDDEGNDDEDHDSSKDAEGLYEVVLTKASNVNECEIAVQTDGTTSTKLNAINPEFVMSGSASVTKGK